MGNVPNTSVSSLYRGRFAPSPTGPLHFGSLVTATGSYLDARANRGEWLLRIEDIDMPRTVPGAADSILRTLEGFGFEWDGEMVFQSQRLDAYQNALASLQSAGKVYPCSCSRSEIAAVTNRRAIDGGLLYPGTCRSGRNDHSATPAWRLQAPDREFVFHDRIQGKLRQNLAREVGDFVLRRSDGWYVYQLAVVVDDAEQNINHIVRGADLLDSTARQLWCQECLGLPCPIYAHLPVAVNPAGEKLSKQTHAAPADPRQGVALLARCMNFLGHAVPGELQGTSLADFWRWAITTWSIAKVPAVRAICAD